MVRKVRTSWALGGDGASHHRLLCTSRPQHLSMMLSISKFQFECCQPAGDLKIQDVTIRAHRKAGLQSWVPTGHRGKFSHGLKAPMTTAYSASRRHPIFILMCGLDKAMAILAAGGIPEPRLSSDMVGEWKAWPGIAPARVRRLNRVGA